MRRLTFLLAALVCALPFYSQDMAICQEIVNTAVDAVNNRSVDELKKHLAPDFTCAGQTGAVAGRVVELLVIQLDEHISEVSKLSEQREDSTLTLVYDFNYSKKLGHKQATFVFNANNQLKQMELLSVQVKKVNTKTDFEASAQDIITVPMEIRENLIVVTAKLNGVERKFILDSGAPTLYLNSQYFSKDTIHSMSDAQSVNSSISGQDVVRIDAFDFCGIQVQDEDFLMSDLSHLLQGEEIYGLIGYQIIKDYDWLFDYEHKTLTLIKPERTAAYIGQMQSVTCEVPLQLTSETSHIPFVQGMIGGRVLSLGIDSGAAGNLLDASLFDKLGNDLTGVTVTDLRGASKDVVEVKQATVKCLTIGGKQFQNIVTSFSDISHLNSRWENKIDGLIGYEILSRQKTLVSVHSKKVVFIQ